MDPEVVPQEQELKTNWRFLIAVPVVLILIGLGLLIYSSSLLPTQKNENDIENINAYSQKPRISRAEIPLDGNDIATSTTSNPDWSLYRNNKVGIQFEYPSDWVVTNKLFEDQNITTWITVRGGNKEGDPIILVTAIPNLNNLLIDSWKKSSYEDFLQIFQGQDIFHNKEFIYGVEKFILNDTEIIKYSTYPGFAYLNDFLYQITNKDYTTFVNVYVEDTDIDQRFRRTLMFIDHKLL